MGNEMATFSERLKSLRTKNKLTQKQLAEKLEISAGSIVAYEKATKVPSIDICVKIALFFNVSMDWLCGLTDDAKNYQIRNYGDAFRMIVSLHEWIGVRCIDSGSVIENWAIEFKDHVLIETIAAWQKVKELYDSRTIDKEIYGLWIDKQLGILDKKEVLSYLIYSGETIEFDEDMKESEIENLNEI